MICDRSSTECRDLAHHSFRGVDRTALSVDRPADVIDDNPRSAPSQLERVRTPEPTPPHR
jgi:hypothetical protein